MTSNIPHVIITDTMALFDHRVYATERAAKAAITRALKKRTAEAPPMVLQVMPQELYNVIRPYKTVRSLMTGEMISIPINTPHSCDPSCETYWSM